MKTQTRTDGDGIYRYRASIASRRAVTRVGTGMGSVPLHKTEPQTDKLLRPGKRESGRQTERAAVLGIGRRNVPGM